MGFFKKLWQRKEIFKTEKTHEIICLHCFKNFTHDRVMFRALMVLDEEGYRAQRDRTLDNYRAKFHMDTAGELPVALDATEFSDISKTYRRGVLVSLKDAYDFVTSKRICPYCHNDLPKSAGFAPSIILSFVGASHAGKSVYMTSLIHALKTTTPRNFPIFCTPLNHEMSRKFKTEYEDPLIENGHLLDPTQKEKQQEPFIFTFSFADETKPEINIAFFDAAGEGMVDNEYMEIYASHIKNSSGIFFLTDPLQFKAIGRKILLKNNFEYELKYAEDPVDVLNGLVEDYIAKETRSVSHIPTAVVLTKTDLLEALTSDGEYVHPGSHMFSNYAHKNVFDLNAFENINGEVNEFIESVDPNFRNALKRRFAELGFFAVSALGTHPDTIKQRVASFAPVRVDEPFLWILYKLGYLEGKRP